MHNRVNSCGHLISQSNSKDLDRFYELYIEPLERGTDKFIQALKKQTNETRSKRATLQGPISETISSNLSFDSIDNEVFPDLVHVESPRSLAPPRRSFYRSVKQDDDDVDRIESVEQINDIVRSQQNENQPFGPFAAADNDVDNENTQRTPISQLATTTVQANIIRDPFAAGNDDEEQDDESANGAPTPQFTITRIVQRKKIRDPFAADGDDDADYDEIVQTNASIGTPTGIISVIQKKLKDPFAANDDDDNDQEPPLSKIPM